MSYALLEEAERIVNHFGVASYLNDQRHRLREQLIKQYQESVRDGSAPDEFTKEGSPALQTVNNALQAGASAESSKTVIGELAARHAGNERSARRTASLNVLLYILNRSVAECWNDTDDWKAMEQTVRAALFDPATIEDDIVHICRDVLKLDAYIEKKREIIKERLLSAHGVLHDMKRSSIAEADRPRPCNIVAHLATGVILCNDTEDARGSVEAALADIQSRVDGTGDPTTFATFFAAFYILAWLMREDVERADVWQSLNMLMAEEFLKYA